MGFEHRCWAQVDLDILRHNYKIVKDAAGGLDIMAVVKADAYGHGDVAVAALLEREGAAAFAVSNFDEAVRLRNAGIAKPLLILGYAEPAHAAEFAKYDVTQTVYSLAFGAALSSAAAKAGVRVKIQLKIDTGMGRIGFAARDDFDAAMRDMLAVCALPNLEVTGAFMHFAVADSLAPSDLEYTKAQYALFTETIAALREAGVTLQSVHCSNSAGAFAWKAFREGMQLVRAGIILYGESPSDEVTLEGIRPALTLKATVSHVKDVPAGDDISYGRTYSTPAPRRIATVTVGYADGYPRLMSNKGTTSIHGKPARIVGRVCMDQMMVDVSEIDGVAMGDEVIVYGGGAADSAADIAHSTDTISYEILCDLARRVSRVYLENGVEVKNVNYLSEG